MCFNIHLELQEQNCFSSPGVPRIRQSGMNKCTHKYSCVSCVPQIGQSCVVQEQGLQGQIVPMWKKRPGCDCKPWGEFLCDPGHVSWPAGWDSPDKSLSHSPKHRGAAEHSSWGAWASAELMLQQHHPAQHPLHLSLSWHWTSPEAANKKPRLELHLSCFPQSLKMLQKTGLKLNLMSCASFYLWTSGPKCL